ncbi:ECF transporter S component [Paratissierella segnis]|jgi:riboflavin transporter FmnP|uniref:ECF transporter S component n=1 Tax=Paratissierella segnis TaxID=2763679 RepID=A0A926EUZ3_9FIRM|nr:ECF transporter S component [Paratissierella segnis]MBC8586794.1 ECF transporter S component [Paratissierella segnis]
MKKNSIKNLVLAGLFVALGLILPSLTGRIPALGQKVLPMHIPVLISGFVCGWPYGLMVGFVTPLLASVINGMPPMFPVAIAMAFELGAYGLLTGLFYKLFPKKPVFTYLTLILAMLGGRVILGIANVILLGLNNAPYTFEMFIAGAFTNAIIGIIIQIIIIPILINALQKARLI